jgi:predicted anti-sigma-YlaC factor YlaD
MDAIASQLVGRRPGRFAYATLAAALAASAVVVVVVWDAAWWPAVAFALAPDVAALYGIAPGLARGQLHPRAVPLYNALHRFWGPLAFAVVVLATGLPLGHVAGALAWAGHVAFDRAIGLRLRTADGFQRGDNALTC